MVADYSETLGGTFVVYAPQSVIFGNMKVYTAMIWVLVLLATIMILFLITSIYKMVKDPFEKNDTYVSQGRRRLTGHRNRIRCR